MSKPSGLGRPPHHRKRLPRQRKSLRLDLRPEVYERLRLLAGCDTSDQPKPLVEVIECLIAGAALPDSQQ